MTFLKKSIQYYYDIIVGGVKMSKGKGSKVTLQVKITPEMRNELVSICNEQGRDISEVLREATYWAILNHKARKQKILGEPGQVVTV